MTLLDFGQPTNGVFQMAYTVENIRSAIEQWSTRLKAGPFFLLDHVTGDDPIYRGKPSKADVAIAMGFCAHMQIELIQPNDDHPSVYREAIEIAGYGFHHFAFGTYEFEADVGRYEDLGFDLAFRAGVPTGGSVAYMDTRGAPPGFLELIEVNNIMEEVFTRFYQASVGWDGGDPVRPFA